MTLKRCNHCGKLFKKLNESNNCEQCVHLFYLTQKMMNKYNEALKGLANK